MAQQMQLRDAKADGARRTFLNSFDHIYLAADRKQAREAFRCFKLRGQAGYPALGEAAREGSAEPFAITTTRALGINSYASNSRRIIYGVTDTRSGYAVFSHAVSTNESKPVLLDNKNAATRVKFLS